MRISPFWVIPLSLAISVGAEEAFCADVPPPSPQSPAPPKVADTIPTPLFGHYACFEGMSREQKVAVAREFIQKTLKDKAYPTAQKEVDLTKTDQANGDDTLFAVIMAMVYAERLTEVREDVYRLVAVGEEMDRKEMVEPKWHRAEKLGVMAMTLVRLDGDGKALFELIVKDGTGVPALIGAYLTAWDLDDKKIERLLAIRDDPKNKFQKDENRSFEENEWLQTKEEGTGNVLAKLPGEYWQHKDGGGLPTFQEKLESFQAEDALGAWFPRAPFRDRPRNDRQKPGFNIFFYLNPVSVSARNDLRALAKENYAAVEHHIRTADLGMVNRPPPERQEWDDELRAIYRRHLLMLIEDLDPKKKDAKKPAESVGGK